MMLEECQPEAVKCADSDARGHRRAEFEGDSFLQLRGGVVAESQDQYVLRVRLEFSKEVLDPPHQRCGLACPWSSVHQHRHAHALGCHFLTIVTSKFFSR